MMQKIATIQKLLKLTIKNKQNDMLSHYSSVLPFNFQGLLARAWLYGKRVSKDKDVGFRFWMGVYNS